MASDLVAWALPRVERLLPLDHESLRQIIDYADSLPKDAAADHLKNLLGDSPPALEFISSFNSRRRNAPSSQPASAQTSRPTSRQPSPPTAAAAAAAGGDGVPRTKPRQTKKKQPNIHSLPARQVEGHGNTAGAYLKRDEEDYMASSSKPKANNNSLASALSLSSKPAVSPSPPSGLLNVPPPSSSSSTPKSHSSPSSRTASPAPKAKVTLTGGQAMSGASSALSDLDSAIRALELQTNPSLGANTPLSERQCGCMATTHPLLTVAPNCLACGNIVCVKQGLGPCVSCAAPLLSHADVVDVLRVLKDERGAARQAEGNRAHRRAEVASKPKPFSGRDFLSSTSAAASPLGSRDPSPSAAAAATAHRDRLLAFQAQNAQRTTVHDEAADFALPVEGADGTGRLRGGNAWASPADRALELKKQQKVLREWEFNNRPDWERKRVVASIDLVRGKVVRRFVEEKFKDRHPEGQGEEEEEEEERIESGGAAAAGTGTGGGAFSRNPLLGKMIRPVFKAEVDAQREKTSTWRRVQDDLDDNEDVILDGGTRGFTTRAQEVA